MKMKKGLVFLPLLIMGLTIGLIAFQGPGGGQGSRYRSSLLPLTDAEKATLIHMREEEKLARDVYIQLYEYWDATIFSRISISEQRHMDALLKMLVKYGVPDPAAGNAIGVFKNPDFQKLYTDLVARGKLSLLDAYLVGKDIEDLDIKDLQAAIEETNKADLDSVYGNLLNGSYNHLRAFASHI